VELKDKDFIASDDGLRTFRKRQMVGKSPLPIPPLLDPRVDAARRKHEQPRITQENNDLTPFQRELMNNPYGMMIPLTILVHVD